MVTVHKITGIWIEEIEKIEATEPKQIDELAFSKRTITIWTTKGEKVELILEAVSSDQLEFKQPDDSWLKPKLYKGKSMHEEELEDQS